MRIVRTLVVLTLVAALLAVFAWQGRYEISGGADSSGIWSVWKLDRWTGEVCLLYWAEGQAKLVVPACEG